MDRTVGNNGCIDVSGQVVGRSGKAQSFVEVAVHAAPGGAFVFGSGTLTDAKGSFRIRSYRFSGEPPQAGKPDTLSIYSVATDRRAGVVAGISDSVLTVVTVAPIGTVPSAQTVRITLPVP